MHSLGKEAANAGSANLKKQIKARLQAARRLQGVYWPRNERLKLVGIKLQDADGGEVTVTNASAIQEGLKA